VFRTEMDRTGARLPRSHHYFGRPARTNGNLRALDLILGLCSRTESQSCRHLRIALSNSASGPLRRRESGDGETATTSPTILVQERGQLVSQSDQRRSGCTLDSVLDAYWTSPRSWP
jgi:hypothetical protein